MTGDSMSEPGCATCSFRAKYDDRPKSLLGRLWRWHANRWGISYEENAHLVCHHAMLAAVSSGLGTTIIGLIPPIVDRTKTLRERYGIPTENRVVTSLILGHPKYRYRQGIRRDLAGVTFH